MHVINQSIDTMCVN